MIKRVWRFLPLSFFVFFLQARRRAGYVAGGMHDGGGAARRNDARTGSWTGRDAAAEDGMRRQGRSANWRAVVASARKQGGRRRRSAPLMVSGWRGWRVGGKSLSETSRRRMVREWNGGERKRLSRWESRRQRVIRERERAPES